MGRSIVGLLLVFVMASQLAGEPLSVGKWLVDLGRDYPLSPQAGLSDVDAEITLLLMQAASLADPQESEAYRWQTDLLDALGREDQARQALETYVHLVPADVPAQLMWVDAVIDSLQTAEARSAFCREQLARPDQPRAMTGELHRRLAEFYVNRGDEIEARQHAETAVRDDRCNLAARRLLDEIQSKPNAPEGRIAPLLTWLAMSPADVRMAARLGDELMLLRMLPEADLWYQHADAVYRILPPKQPSPTLLVARAWIMVEMGKLDEAKQLALTTMRLAPSAVEARLLRVYVARKQNDEKNAAAHLSRATGIWRSLVDQGSDQLSPDTLADAAWFFAHDDPQPAGAEKLARQALQQQPNSLVATRSLGAALRGLTRLEEAEKVLAPLVDVDRWAAIESARVLQSTGQKTKAIERLRAATTQPATSEQRCEMADLMAQWQESMPATQPAPPPIKALLDAFPKEVLDYPFHPDKYLSLSLHMPYPELPVAEPWRCTFQLNNKGTFPITMGQDLMMAPELLCQIETHGDRARSSGPVFRVRINGHLQLEAGESFALTQTMDIGPIRAGMIGTPQVSQEVLVSAIANPTPVTGPDGQDHWEPGIGGLRAQVRFRRPAFVVEGEKMQALLMQSQAPEVNDRIVAMETLAMLLAEQQHLAAGRLRYAARKIDPALVQAVLLARSKDADWRVRARLAECMRWFTLDPPAMQTAVNLLNDPHWLVRGLAMRMLVDQRGAKAEPVLTTAAARDPNDWVRRLSQALLARLARAAASSEPAASQPATMPVESPGKPAGSVPE